MRRERTLVRRERTIVTAALIMLTTLAWAYVWWLAADMDMGGMDMAGFRMIPAGMGLVMNHYVRCTTRGTKLVVSGANNRVMDLFKVTKVDTVLPLVSSLDEAEA